MHIFVQGRNRLGEKKVLDRKKRCYIVGDVTTKKWACLYVSNVHTYDVISLFFNASDSNIGTKKVRNLKGQMAIFNNTMLCTTKLHNVINQ